MADMTTPQLHLATEPEWHEHTRSFLDFGYQQTWAYGHALARQQQARCEFAVLRDAGEVIGVAAVRIRAIPVLGGGIAYVSAGPLTRRAGDDADDGRFGQCLDALSAHYVERHGYVLRCLAPLGPPAWNEAVRAVCRARGWSEGAGRRHRTLWLDLDRPLDDVRAACSKYWRRNLRRGERGNLTVRVGTAADMFETLTDLYAVLRARKRFDSDLDVDFYRSLQARLPVDDALVVAIAELEGRPVAGLVGSMLGDTGVPLVLAAEPDGLRAYANYRLQWCSIAMAHERGLRAYDLGGIDPEGNTGVFNFKKGLGGEDVTAAGPFEVSPDSVRGALARHADRLYRRLAA
jgi:CelD/BcsL family acetyltransferase involved in cellulose biosynthesis